MPTQGAQHCKFCFDRVACWQFVCRKNSKVVYLKKQYMLCEMTNWLMAILQLLELSYFLIYSFLALKTTTGLLQGGKQIL